jgi:hypothetical protein
LKKPILLSPQAIEKAKKAKEAHENFKFGSKKELITRERYPVLFAYWDVQRLRAKYKPGLN